MERQSKSKISINGIVGIIVFVMIAFLFVMVTGGIIRLLYSWVPLALFAGALLVNYRTVLNYIRFLINRFKANPLNGVVSILLTVVFYPFVAGFLLGKAFLDRKLMRLKQPGEVQDEFVEYEDLTDDLDLKPLSKADPEGRYDKFLDEESN